MHVLETIAEMQAWSDAARRAGHRIGFVPTMGFLHDGHAQLMREAAKACDRVVVSIFVNPTQFGPTEDFDKYPRNPEGDRALCTREGVAAVFFPSVAEMYPAGAQTWVDVSELSQDHCGADRPGHFRGVATVVTKLFHAVRPDMAFFGEKDFQQLAVIRQLERDLNFGIRIVGVPTVREADGLALSSRNKYLSPGERDRALALSRGLREAEAAVARGLRTAEELIGIVLHRLSEVDAQVDYVHLVDPRSLARIGVLEETAVMLVAARIGTTRLIDNLTLVAPLASGPADRNEGVTRAT